MTGYAFEATLYPWDARTDTWIFADVPFDIADEIEDAQVGPRRGFGAVKVEVTVGGTTWRTSIFPSQERRTFVLPVKRAVLKAESLAPDQSVAFELRTLS